MKWRDTGITAGFVWWMCAAALFGQQPPVRSDPNELTLAIRSQLVEIYFTATEGSRRVSSLSASDLSLCEDGVQKEILRLDSGNVPLQLALLLDISESMRDALYSTQEAAVSFLESMNPADRVTLITFNTDIRSIPQLTDDREALISAVRSTQARGVTKLYDALLYAMKLLSGKEGRKALVVFSDGEDTARTASLEMVLNAAARYGFPIYSIYAGSGEKSLEHKKVLRRLADINSGRMFLVEKEQDLRAAFAEVATELRSAFVANYYTQAPPDGRWHDLRLVAGDSRLKIHTRKGFFAASGEPGRAGRRSGAIAVEEAQPAAPSSRATLPRGPAARAAMAEILAPSVPVQEVQNPHLPSGASGPASQAPRPVFKVESRFVEVPVMVETGGAKKLPELSAKDFRIYENDALRDIVFFNRDITARDLPRLREMAMKKIEGAGEKVVSSPAGDTEELILARYYLVLDDLMTDTMSFMEARKAAEKIIRTYHSGLRRFSFHLASEAQAAVARDDDLEGMLRKIQSATSYPNRELTSNEGIMSIYQAYLIEAGDTRAMQVAELSYAASLMVSYQNALGEVEGTEPASTEMIQSGVGAIMRSLVGENFARVTRTLDGLRSVVNAASLEPGSYPKVVIFLSSGFVLGRASGRSDMGGFMNRLVETAKRNGIRVFTVDAAGLAVQQTVGVATGAPVLAHNPHLEPIAFDHSRGWQVEKESSLNQLAADSGGRYLHNTNDLAAAAGAVLNTTGQMYYIGYLSNQPADGRFHRIRVSTSLPSARVHARKGYFAGRHNQPDTLAETTPDGEDWQTVFERAEAARKAGDWKQFVGALEQLVARFPNQPNLWYNLGAARLNLNEPARAAEALQKAFALAPDDNAIGLALVRAFAADGLTEAAAETLKMMIRRRPREAALLVQLGRIYEANSRPEEAHQAYRKVLDLSLSPALDLYLLLIRTSVSLDRRVEAGLFIQDYLARGGSDDHVDPWRRRLATNPPQ